MGMGVPKFGGSPKFCDTGLIFFFGRDFDFEIFLNGKVKGHILIARACILRSAVL